MSKKIGPDFSQEPGPALHSARWRFGAFELDETRRELRRDGELIAVEPKPLNLLMLLLRHPGELVTKNELLETLWTGRVVSEAVVGNCVSSVREALRADGPVWLKTVHGFGYRFDAPVQLIEEDNRAPTIAAPRLDFQAGDQPPMRPNWQLVRRLGRSGDSWLGEHVKTRARRVFKFTTDPRGLSALKREVTVYRLLRESVGDKVCYVDLLDWNFDEAPWFVEAEYCPGGSLQEWFDAQGGIGKVPLATRLDLIAQIAEALAEIHLVGVLHKDLKPANIFVVASADGQPTIRLADFGSSRLLDPARLAALEITRMGFTQVIDSGDGDNSSGTPLYLAPEVLTGHPATVKADIYALGVMLYQFTIGNLRRQLAAGWEAEVDDDILRDDIAAAAEGNPERRLADAGELARNLRRLESRRVTREAARAAAEKAEKAARALERMRARRIGVVFAFAALVTGFVVSTTLYLRAVRAQENAESQTTRANLVSRFLAEGIFSSVDGTDRPLRNITVKQLLDSASLQLPKTFAEQPEVEAEVRLSLGNAYSSMEYPTESGEQLEAAANIYRRLHGDGSAEVLRASRKLVANYFDRKLLSDAIPRLARSADAGRTRLPANNIDLIRFELELARGESLLGRSLQAKHRLERLLATVDVQASNLVDADISLLIGWVEVNLGNFDNALRSNRFASERYESRRGKTHISALNAKRQYIAIMIELERFDDARKIIIETETRAAEWATDTSAIMVGLRQARAEIDARLGNARQAIALLEATLSKYMKKPEIIDESGPIRRKLAAAYRLDGRLADSRSMVRKSMEISAANLGPRHPETIAAQLDLFDYMDADMEAQIDEGLVEALRLASGYPIVIDQSPVKARWLSSRARYLQKLGKVELARSAGAEAIALMKLIYGTEHSMTKAAVLAASRIERPKRLVQASNHVALSGE